MSNSKTLCPLSEGKLDRVCSNGNVVGLIRETLYGEEHGFFPRRLSSTVGAQATARDDVPLRSPASKSRRRYWRTIRETAGGKATVASGQDVQVPRIRQ